VDQPALLTVLDQLHYYSGSRGLHGPCGQGADRREMLDNLGAVVLEKAGII
jgi:hypothetical protein